MTAPACAAECRTVLIDGMTALGTDAHITHVPPIVPSKYEPLNLRCPHGVRWYAEPTGEQIARYAAEGTP